MYDQRLFNQDVGGAGAGMGGEDSYNIYDKPLFADRAELFKHTVGWAGRRGAGSPGGCNFGAVRWGIGFTRAVFGCQNWSNSAASCV